MATRRDILIKARNIAIGTVVVLVLLVGAGVGYTWYVGTQPVAEAATEEVAPAPKRAARVSPSKPAPDAVVSVSSQLLTSPVVPGENASLSIKTNAGATCEITITYGEIGDEDKQSADSGLKPKVADEYGMATWTWTVEADRPLGEWPVEVTCANEKNDAYLRVNLEVASKKQN